MIGQIGLLRVVREVGFGSRHLGERGASRFRGSNLMVDLLVLREPGASAASVGLASRFADDGASPLWMCYHRGTRHFQAINDAILGSDFRLNRAWLP